MEVRLGCCPSAGAPGPSFWSALAVAAPYPHDHVVYLDHEIDELALGLDEILRHVFSSG